MSHTYILRTYKHSFVSKGSRNVRSGKQLNKLSGHHWKDEELAVDLPISLRDTVQSITPRARVSYFESLNRASVMVDLVCVCSSTLTDAQERSLKDFCAMMLVDGSAGFEHLNMFVAQSFDLEAKHYEIEKVE